MNRRQLRRSRHSQVFSSVVKFKADLSGLSFLILLAKLKDFVSNFGQVLREPAHVTWEITRPSVQAKKHGSFRGESIVSSFEVTVPAGTDRFDQLVQFAENDRVGEWKLHVAVDGISVLNRSIRVVSKTSGTSDD